MGKDSDPDKWDYPPHTKAKHAILANYLDAWYPILASTRGRILYLDGFAGRGRYDGGEPGSPIIALDRLLCHSAWDRMKHREFVFLFIEHDRDNADSLERALQQYRADYEAGGRRWPASVKYEVRHGTFADNAKEIVSYLREQKARLAPTFAMVDPFGWTGMPMAVMADLLNHPSCEAFVNFMVGFVNRFLEHPDQTSNMDELFGAEVRDVLSSFTGADRVAHLRDFYIGQLQRIGGFPYVRWFAMYNDTGNVGYYLLHGTREALGVERMKDAMWKTAPTGDYSFHDRLAGADVLFVPDPDLGPLETALRARLAGQGPVAVNPTLQSWVVLETPFRKPHLTSVLRKLEQERSPSFVVHRPPGKRQFSAGVTVETP